MHPGDRVVSGHPHGRNSAIRRSAVARSAELGVNRFNAHAAILVHRASAIFPEPAVVDGKLRSAMTACLNGLARLSILDP